MKTKTLLIFVLFVLQQVFAQSIVIGSGASIYVPEGADICAGEYGNISGEIFGEGTQCGESPVPVELISFTATEKNNSVKLYWRTGTELNNRGFEILRNVSGDEWIKLGFVEGNGNSNSPEEYSFTDENPVGGSKFQYKLKQIDNDGQFKYSEIVEVEIVPNRFALFQNYPNPFNPVTTIDYQLPQTGFVTLKLYDMLGNEITTLVNEHKNPGRYSADFDGSNLASGFYIYQLRVNNFVSSKKLMLLK